MMPSVLSAVLTDLVIEREDFFAFRVCVPFFHGQNMGHGLDAVAVMKALLQHTVAGFHVCDQLFVRLIGPGQHQGKNTVFGGRQERMLTFHEPVNPFAAGNPFLCAVVVREHERGQRQIIRGEKLLPQLLINGLGLVEFLLRAVFHGKQAGQGHAHMPPEGGKESGFLIDQIPAGVQPVPVGNGSRRAEQIRADGRQIAAVPFKGIPDDIPGFNKLIAEPV